MARMQNQNQMQNQMQMQARLQNQFVQHPNMPGFGSAPQMAAVPWQSGSMAGSGMQGSPYFSSQSGMIPGAGSVMNPGPGGGWTVSESPLAFEIPGGSGASMMGAPSVGGPVPDPAFSTGGGSGAVPAPAGPVASGAPISTISLSTQPAPGIVASGSGAPLVEAF